MKIAYFLQLNTAPGAGINKKVFSQIRSWQRLGYNVAVFVLTKRADTADEIRRAFPQTHVQTGIYQPTRWPPPLDGRLPALSQLITQIEHWSPDLVYTRQDLYLPPLRRLLDRQRVVVEINTNDLGELRGNSRLFLAFYRATRGLLLRHAAGLVYVSHEIAQLPHYQKFKVPHTVIGNGIALDTIPPSPPVTSSVRLVFIGSAGQSWHGVDKMLRLAVLRPEWHFDLIGITQADTNLPLPPNVTLHGHLNTADYQHLLAQACCAIGTLALHRKHMQEASPLKVREYLAYGLPVIIGYLDTDFPSGADFMLRLPNIESNVEDNLEDIDRFVQAWRGRRVPREAAERLDYARKEQERLAFFGALLKGQGTQGMVSAALLERTP